MYQETAVKMQLLPSSMSSFTFELEILKVCVWHQASKMENFVCKESYVSVSSDNFKVLEFFKI